MSPSSLLQRVAGRAGGNGQSKDQRPEHDSAADKPLPLEDKPVPEQPRPRPAGDPNGDRAKQAIALRDRFNKLVASARAGELGLTLQTDDQSGGLTGLVMSLELVGTDLKLVAVAKLFGGQPITVHFPE
jgi:hypothetical protein